ncbi:hypothetical protein Nepgr_032257 [Nepenthes gracilis]|uniref:Secreted protein n=1 Tax=Nepenthes gracilis TaxID=150966 RepID=A0AAD3TJM3_NEPGR|nr:hypothetical protein Nepgr_032257 [Nepenthes gracilis]
MMWWLMVLISSDGGIWMEPLVLTVVSPLVETSCVCCGALGLHTDGVSAVFVGCLFGIWPATSTVGVITGCAVDGSCGPGLDDHFPWLLKIIA